MHPKKEAVDNKPNVVGKVSRIPGTIGWGMERKHLLAEHNIITDDMQCQWPIPKGHLKELDNHFTAQFTRFTGDKAQKVDKMHGIDYSLYNALNMQAQRSTLQFLDQQRKIDSAIPNVESGLGRVDAMNKTMQTEKSFNQPSMKVSSADLSNDSNLVTYCHVEKWPGPLVNASLLGALDLR